MSERQRDEFPRQVISQNLPHPVHRLRGRWQIENLAVIPPQPETHIRRGEGVQSKLMLHMRRFGRFRSQKFPPGRHVKKQRPRLDHRAGRTTGVPHIAHFSTIHQNLGSGHHIRFPCHHPKARHTRDARHRLTAKTQGPDRREITGCPQLTRRMALQ